MQATCDTTCTLPLCASESLLLVLVLQLYYNIFFQMDVFSRKMASLFFGLIVSRASHRDAVDVLVETCLFLTLLL